MKVNALSEEDPNTDEVVPIPVQIFLWRQTTPFVRPRLGKVHDAACMFCQRAPGHHELKEACKSFEKVLVQNLRFGLSISLSEAIEAIPRWRLIQAALPHVMHALAALLHNRVKDNMQSLGNVETKLLYTMHWIILDASDECADSDYENGIMYSNPFHYLFSVPAITLFVFLFAPISHHLKESDFTNNYRLENGLKIWQGMWEYRHPDAPCFTTMVKPKPRPLGGKYSKRPQQSTDVFLGRKFSKEEAGSPPSQNVSMSQSEVTSKQASTEEEPWPLSSPKDTIFPETIPEESSSTEEEHVFIYRLPNEQNKDGPAKEAYTVYAADPSIFQIRKTETDKQKQTPTPPGIKPLPQITKMSSSDKESLSDSGGGPAKGTPTSAEKSPPTSKQVHVCAATFLDVATLRCLFTSTWQEEGVYWGLHYLYNRLRDICDELSKQTAPRKRSNSLPIPKIEVSIYQSPDMKERESLKNFIEVPEPKDISPITEIPFPPSPTKADDEHVMLRRSSEKVKKKMKMADLKAFVETKLLSKSEKALEKIGHDDHKFSFHTAVRMISEYHRSLDHTDDRPNSALASNYPPLTPRGLGAGDMSDFLQCNLIKGKSMPSLSCLIDELASNGYIGEMKTERAHGPSGAMPAYVQKKNNPIITVTEHTPTPSPDYLSKTRQGSMESQIDSVSMQGSQHIPTPERKPSLTRSQTDSNITYVVEEVQEAPGSLHYITKDGDINFQVVLKVSLSLDSVSIQGSQHIPTPERKPSLTRSQTVSNITYVVEEVQEAPGSLHYITKDGDINFQVVFKVSLSLDSVSMQGSQHIPTPERKPSLTRSQTDSNITYVVEEVQVAPGSLHYITKDGDINFQVVLKVSLSLDSVSMQGSQHIPTTERKPSLTRSQTDSNITYVVKEVQEAPGSLHYITKDGDINFQVVLKVSLSPDSVSMQGSQHIPTPERKPSLTRSQTDPNITYVVEEVREAPGSLHYITKDGDINFQVVLKVSLSPDSVSMQGSQHIPTPERKPSLTRSQTDPNITYVVEEVREAPGSLHYITKDGDINFQVVLKVSLSPDSVSMQGSQHIPTPERKPSLTRSQTDPNITYVVEEVREAPGSLHYITKDGDINFQVVLKVSLSLDSVSMQGSQHIPTPERKPSLTRSQTDSNITYVVEEVQEAPGSLHYITKDGDINFQVVLKVSLSLDLVSMQGSQHIPTTERKPSLTRSQTESNITYVVKEVREAPGSLHYITKDGDINFQVVLKVSLSPDSVSMQGSQHIPTPERKPSLTRSQTDPNITYVVEEVREAPGSLHYITKDGDINFQVVLKVSLSLDSVSMQGSQHIPTPERKPSLTRSQTDSNITYVVEEVQEAPGSLHYITKDGDINFQVVLKAVYSVSTMDSFYITLRVMEVMLNMVDTLMEIGVHKNWDPEGDMIQPGTTVDPLADFSKEKDSKERDSGIPCAQSQDSTNVDGGDSAREKLKEEENTDCPYYMIMHIVLRLLRQLGCSHGCTTALRGPQAECLRVQARNSLRALRTANIPKFTQRLREMTKFAPIREVMDNLHATIGFCAEPTSMVSPMNAQKRKPDRSPEISQLQQGYATYFGQGNNQGPNANKAIETFIIESVFRVLVTRFAILHKELKMLDNSALYSEVRLLLSYVREAHGSEFRAVAFSALIDTAERPDSQQKESNMQTTRVIRHIPRSTDDERGSDTGADSGCAADEKTTHNKKFTFKKRSTSSTGAHSLLDTEGGDESASQSPLSVRTRRYQLTPRQSERTIPSADITPHHKSHVHAKSIQSKFHISGIVNWFRQRPASQTQSLLRNGGGSGESLPMSGSTVSLARPHHSTAAHTSRPVHVKRRVGYTLNRARKRVEDRLNRFGLRKMGKKRDGSIEDERTGGFMSRRGSAEGGSGGGESEVVVLKRRRLVQAAPLYAGLARFNLIIDATQPGGTPDALFMAAILDLPHTVVVGRAAILLECAHLVHNCNKGQWPYWLKSNVVKNATSVSPQLKRQRLAAKLFYQWAEAIGNRLEEMLIEDKKHIETVTNLVTDPDGQRELLQQDEEEDFLDEASIRIPGKPIGAECPRALRMIACVLLFEITSFLRETFQTIPKTSNVSLKERGPWDRVYRWMEKRRRVLCKNKEANRRWSMALSSMGHSQASAQSLQSIAGVETERKISFVLHEPENVSGGSNVTLADAIPPAVDDKKGRLASRGGKGAMHRRNTQQTHNAFGSFKRRSIKLRQKDVKEVDEFVTRRSDSIQSRRKVSSLSDRSDTSEVYPGTGTVLMSNEADSGGEESPGVLSDDHDHPPDSPDSNSTDPPDHSKGYPWLKTLVKFLNSFNYVCCHQNFCHPYCFRRNMRASIRLMKSVQKIYGEKFGPEVNQTNNDENSGSARRGRRARKSSEHSTDRIDRSVIESAGLAYRAAGVENAPTPHAEAPPVTKPGAIPYPPVDPPAILKYLKTHVRDAYHMPLAALVKGATIMPEECFVECAPMAWQLLLEADRELSACAASLFILCAVKAPQTASDIMHEDLKHSEPGVRINAILRFQVMWKLRYQVWPRMEEGASMTFKVPPPGIEFTLPSPKIGIESLAVVDPPWCPQVKDKDMEMTLNQERHRSLVTATKTRKKQQTEAIKRALQQRNDRKKAERECFLITTIPITRQAAREPALDHAVDDHIEAPADEEMAEGVRGSHHTQVASALFPSALCSAVSEIISLLDDAAVSRDGCSVYEVAYSVIWGCLVEDSALFLRHVLERLTRDHQDEMFKLLRHLIRFIPRLPQQAAFALYNYIIGYVMFYVRTPHEDGQRLIGAALSILWMVVHSVHGIMFKDLKQILRKEQCDAHILLTANVPAAKKIIVHGPSDNEGSIPSQFPVQEDTQFAAILKESLDFFGIPEDLQGEHFLVDFKTRQIHNPQNYVRDHYFFKRSQYPQLGLVHMEPDTAFEKLQQQELLLKFVEIGKVLLTWAILKNVDMVVQRVVFLHDELMKLPSFPRKALEADLALYSRGPLGSMLLGLDVLHKFMWVRLIARMFEAMAGNFTSSRDIHLFLNVLNGALMLHSEDSLILRYVIATYVNAAFNFKNIFSTNGYLLIMPTLLQIYSNYQTNKLVTTTIEYAVKQFYLLNRKPFILQMFGSVSAILDTDEEASYGDASKVQSSCLFNLLLSLETPSPDPLHIAELIKEEKPLKPIDFCYRDEDEMVNVLDCISLCVMVVSYSAESMRGYQMLIILEAILPCYVKQIQLPTYNREGKTEKEIIQQLAIAIKTLINNCEGLSKSYNGPYRTSPEHKGSSTRGVPRATTSNFVALDLIDEESHSRFAHSTEHSRMPPVPDYTGAEDSELIRAEYRRPRDVLLSLVGDFIGRVTTRLIDLNGSKASGGAEGKPLELLDSKSHTRLAEIAHSLLKVSPYDPESMGCRGLQQYMLEVLPAADWQDDALRPSLIVILRRLDKVFLKIAKKPSIRRNTDWDSAATLLKGINETMLRHPYIMHWQQLKTLLNTIQALIVSENNSGENLSSASAALMSQPPPPHFCSTVVRLIALQVINAGDSYSLEQMCGGSAVFPNSEKTENMLMNLFMPLCLRVGSGRKDIPPLRQSDVSYIVSVVLNTLCPPAPPGQISAVNAKLNASDARANSMTFTGSRDIRNTTRLSNQLYRIAFLALKVLCACFTSELCSEWGRIARAMRELGRRNEAAHHLWDFLEHVVTYRTPLYVLLQPFIVHKLSQPPIGDNERHMQFIVRERVRGLKLPAARARGTLLSDLAKDLRTMRDTHDHYKFEQMAEQVGQGGKRPSEVYPRNAPTEQKHQQHRPSLISMLVSRAGLPRTPDHPTAPLSAQRESLSSSSTTSQHMPVFDTPSNNTRSDGFHNANIGITQPGTTNNFGERDQRASESAYTTNPKLRFVPSVEFKFTSGETSMSPLSPLSPGEGSMDSEAVGGGGGGLGGGEEDRPRLQRAHGPSKKTFKFRRSRHNKPEPSHMRLESDECSSPGPESTPLRRPWMQTPSTPLLQPTGGGFTDTSYDSEISQTSSTSGYRLALLRSQESYSLQASMTESPGGSWRAALASPEAPEQRSPSATPHASPDASLSCESGTSSAERTALLGAASQRSLLLSSELRDEDTLL